MLNKIVFIAALATLSGFLIAGYLYKKIPALISGYIKVDINRRIIALLIDILACSFLAYYGFYNQALRLPSALALILYVLFRDSLFNGRSLGKIVTGLMVIRLKDGKPVGMADSFLRNFIFIIPALNIGASIFEVSILFKDKQGLRLGDKIAKTQVVMGKTRTESIFDLIINNQQYYRSEKKEPTQNADHFGVSGRQTVNIGVTKSDVI